MTKPLWQKFIEMTPEELDAEQASDLASMHFMSDAEAQERADAYRKAGEWQIQEGEKLLRWGRLASATGCPEGAAVVPWLIAKGLLVASKDGYVLTDKASQPHIVR